MQPAETPDSAALVSRPRRPNAQLRFGLCKAERLPASLGCSLLSLVSTIPCMKGRSAHIPSYYNKRRRDAEIQIKIVNVHLESLQCPEYMSNSICMNASWAMSRSIERHARLEGRAVQFSASTGRLLAAGGRCSLACGSPSIWRDFEAACQLIAHDDRLSRLTPFPKPLIKVLHAERRQDERCDQKDK